MNRMGSCWSSTQLFSGKQPTIYSPPQQFTYATLPNRISEVSQETDAGYEARAEIEPLSI